MIHATRKPDDAPLIEVVTLEERRHRREWSILLSAFGTMFDFLLLPLWAFRTLAY
jgi:hypothetical protein